MVETLSAQSNTLKPTTAWQAWLVCLSAGLFFLYEFFQLNIFDVINQPLRAAFHLDASQLSWMSSTYLWADLLFLLPAGMILDRYSTRSVILLAMGVCVLGTLGFALTDNFILACFFHFLSGIGNAFSFLACVVLVSRWFPPRKQAMVVGSMVTMAFLGGMLAHTPLSYLNEWYGWRSALLIDAALGAFLLLVIYSIVQDRPTGLIAPQSNQSQGLLEGLRRAGKNRQNWLAGFYIGFLNLPIMVLCALWGASYLQVTHHLSEHQASNIVSLIYIGSMIACPLAGYLSDKWGNRKSLMWFGGVATLLCTLPLVSGISMPISFLALSFFALGFFSSTQVIAYPLIAESNPTENTGTATGLASVLIMGGAAIAQIIFGYLISFHAQGMTQYTMADFRFALWMFPVVCFAALWAVFYMRETHCQPQT